MAQQKTKISIPLGFTQRQREAIGEAIIRHIVDRSQSGTGFNPKTGREKRFPGYSKDYAAKKGQSNVDLTLSSEMLGDLDVVNEGSGFVTVGYDSGTESNDKAEGNQKGSYGRSPNPSKARPFIGIKKSALKEIIKEITDDG